VNTPIVGRSQQQFAGVRAIGFQCFMEITHL
jgi:hypothetical protein